MGKVAKYISSFPISGLRSRLQLVQQYVHQIYYRKIDFHWRLAFSQKHVNVDVVLYEN